MRAIFLDIDGVLNCKSTANPRKLPYVIDHKLLERFQRVVDSTGAKVILSSTWHYDPAGLFSARYWGIPFSDITPDLPDKPRREEILSWLEKQPDAERFAIIDDEDDGLDDLPLFQPSSRTGLTEEIAKGVEAYLIGETDKDMRCGRMHRLFQNLSAVLRGHPG
jgi:HAD domain in Swiss Army Knife RNA repair proteins